MNSNTATLIAHIFDNSLRAIFFLTIVFVLYKCGERSDEFNLKKAQIEHGCKS